MTTIPVAVSRFSDNNFKRFHLKKEGLLSIFYSISEMCMKFRTFWNKEQYPGLIVTETIASERDAYLSN